MRKINIQGKDYVPVHERLTEFWKNNPSWSIRTEIIDSPQGKVRFRACVFDENGLLRATGHGEEKENSTFINKSSYVENCETSAIGGKTTTNIQSLPIQINHPLGTILFLLKGEHL